MNKPKIILNILPAFVAIACLAFSAVLLKQKTDLLAQLKEKQFQIDVVEEENQKLSAENEASKRDLEANKEMQENIGQIKTDLENKLKVSEEKVTTLEADLKDAQWKLEQLKSENATLIKDIESLKASPKESAQKVQQQETISSPKTENAPPKKKFILF